MDGYQPLIPALVLRDPHDRHVLAAAIKCGADLILTFNLDDFPEQQTPAHSRRRYAIATQNVNRLALTKHQLHPGKSVIHHVEAAPAEWEVIAACPALPAPHGCHIQEHPPAPKSAEPVGTAAGHPPEGSGPGPDPRASASASRCRFEGWWVSAEAEGRQTPKV